MPYQYALSLPQEDVYYDQLLHEDSAVYNIGAKVEVRGYLDPELFSKAATWMVAQHDSLRSIVVSVDGKPFMQVLDDAVPVVTYHDLSAMTDPVAAADSFIQQRFSEPFDLKNGQLLNCYLLVKVSDAVFYIVGKYHHLVADGWSTALLFSRLGANYTCARLGAPPADEMLSYVDFVKDDEVYRSSEAYTADEEYWREKLSVLEAPQQIRNIHDGRNFELHSKREVIYLERALYNQVAACCKENGLSVFHFLIGAVYTCIAPLVEGDTFMMGLPLLNRKNKRFKETVGLFAGITPLFFKGFNSVPFRELLKNIKDELRESFRHQRLPLSRIVADAGWIKGGDTRPAYQVFFSYEKHDYAIAFDGHPATVLPLTHHLERASLAVYVREFDDIRDVKVDFDYNTTYFDTALIKTCISCFERLLPALVGNIDLYTGDIPLLDISAEERILHSYNATHVDYPLDQTIMDLFAAQVARSPAQTAVRFLEEELSYQELSTHARQLSNRLRQAYGVVNGDVVGIMLDRSWQMLAGILGILGAGAGYVPVDPDHPDTRIRYILSQSRMKVVVSSARYTDWLREEGFTVVLIEEQASDELLLPPVSYDANSLAYVMYTSGSTGQPKGVEIPHRAVVNFLCSMQSRLSLRDGFRLLAVTTYSFDISVLELLLPLLSGGTVIIASREQVQHAVLLSELMKLEKPDIMQCTPGMWQLLLDAGWQGDKELTALCGGERMPVELARRLLKHTGRCWNMYGPTETTIWSCMQEIKEAADAGSIGKPICNTAIYILNARLQPLPEGVAGDIYIGGAGLALGYRDQPALTSSKFIAHPFHEGSRIYRTGDVGRWEAGGRIQFLGRSDDQVKIRGYRVEPGEIEQVLAQHAAVKQATVVAVQGEDGIMYLGAYVVLLSPVTVGDLQSYLRGVLPSYMVPGYIMVLDQLPMSANGKIDRKQLPAVSTGEIDRSGYIAPATPLERQLAGIWVSVLHLDSIGMADNFFEIGGHSLRAMQILSRIHRELGISIGLHDLFDHPVLSSFSELIAARGRTDHYTAIPLVAQQDHYELSHAQRRLWILSQFPEGSLAYNICGAYRIKGPLDKDALQRALQTVVARHESLRTVFVTVDDLPVQRVLDADGFNFEVEEYDQATSQELIAQEQSIPFDLSRGPLIRARLIHLGEQDHLFLLTLHHIITDGWSMEVIVREVLQLYGAYRKGQSLSLPALPLQYKDYASWQHERLKAGDMEQHRQYWLQQLNGNIPPLELPISKKRPGTQTFRGRLFTCELDAELCRQLRQVSQEKQATVFMTLLAAFKVLIHHYTAAQDIVIGTPVSGREHISLYDQAGCFMNMLPIRSKLEEQAPFTDILAQVRSHLLNGYHHQAYPFDVLVEELRLPRDRSRSPLFDIVVGMDTDILGLEAIPAIDGLDITPFTDHHTVSKYDITCMFRDQGGAINIQLEYNTALYDSDSIQTLAAHYILLLKKLLSNTDQCIGDISLLDASAEEEILHSYNATHVDYPLDQTIMDLFAAQVARTPTQTAVRFLGEALSYEELSAHARQLSNRLRHTYGVVNGDVVGIMLDRSWQMLAGMLGILGAGAGYVPVDPDHPDTRIRYILSQSRMKVVVSSARYADWLREEGFTVVLIEEQTNDDLLSPPVSYDANSLAYVMYTSGSTGQPKGVEIPHRAVVNFLCSMQSRLSLREGFRLLAVTTYSFDISVLELLLPLLSGSTVIIASREQVQHAVLLSELMKLEKPDIMQCTPGMWQLLLDAGWQGDKELTALCGGERMPVELARRLLKHTGRCWNMYGPTETTIWSCMQEIKEAADAGSIGKPICNTAIYILNTRLQPLPEGVAGDIYIGGAGLALGYRDQPALTSSRFIAHPFREGSRIYRTGDVGRWEADGRIQFLGRSDDQVKIRGYRVEPGEIEQVLSQHAAVKQAAVVAAQGEDGIMYLGAYVVLLSPVTVGELQGYLRGVLPSYMVPGYIMVLDQLPMSANGKIDRKQLPAVSTGEIDRSGYIAPATPLERQLAGIWASVLHLDSIGMADNFFEIGGHSLRAMQILSRIHRELGISIGLHDLFDHPVLSSFSELIAARGRADHYTAIPLVAQQDHYELSHAQRRLWILSQFPEGSLAYNICGAYQIKGPLDKGALEWALQKVVARHESLRTIFITVDDLPVQRVLDADGFNFEVEEYDQTTSQELVAREQSIPFDLSRGPLIRARLIHLGEQDHLFLLTLHHIITDGWSMEVIVREVLQLYGAYRKGQSFSFPALPLQYKDYASWQHERLKAGDMEQHRQYWLQQLGGGIRRLELPLDHPRPAVFQPVGGRLTAVIPRENHAQLAALAGTYGASMYHLLMAASKVLLHLYTGQQDIVVGYPVSLRNRAELEDQVGFYLNTVALRTYIQREQSYQEVVKMVRESMLQVSQHQEYPFDKIISGLRYTRDASRSPLFDIVVVLQNLKVHEHAVTIVEDLEVTEWPQDTVVSSVDIRLEFIERADYITVNFEYNRALFHADTIRLLMERFLSLLQRVLTQPDIRIADIQLEGLPRTQSADIRDHFSIHF